MNIYRSMYHEKKPEGIEKRKPYIVSGGIAGLVSAVFLIDDAHMPEENIKCVPIDYESIRRYHHIYKEK